MKHKTRAEQFEVKVRKGQDPKVRSTRVHKGGKVYRRNKAEIAEYIGRLNRGWDDAL